MYMEEIKDGMNKLETMVDDKSMKKAVLLIGSIDRKRAVAQFLLDPSSMKCGSKTIKFYHYMCTVAALKIFTSA